MKSHTWLTIKMIVEVNYKNKCLHFITFWDFDKITLNYHMHYNNVSLCMTNTLMSRMTTLQV